MDISTGIILGLIQGITEFIPISSSGHLVLARTLFGIETVHGLSFDAVLHLATALAVVVYFWGDIVGLLRSVRTLVSGKGNESKERVLLWALILGTLPAATIGFFLEDFVSVHTRTSFVVVLALLVGSLVMLAGEHMVGRRELRPLTARSGLWVGFFQALALIPGFSRAGATISGGLFFGLSRGEATRFAFLLSGPLLFGVGVHALIKLGTLSALVTLAPVLLVASLIAFLVGLLAIHFMVRFLNKHSLLPFVLYRTVLAAVVLTILFTSF